MSGDERAIENIKIEIYLEACQELWRLFNTVIPQGSQRYGKAKAELRQQIRHLNNLRKQPFGKEPETIFSGVRRILEKNRQMLASNRSIQQELKTHQELVQAVNKKIAVALDPSEVQAQALILMRQEAEQEAAEAQEQKRASKGAGAPQEPSSIAQEDAQRPKGKTQTTASKPSTSTSAPAAGGKAWKSQTWRQTLKQHSLLSPIIDHSTQITLVLAVFMITLIVASLIPLLLAAVASAAVSVALAGALATVGLAPVAAVFAIAGVAGLLTAAIVGVVALVSYFKSGGKLGENAIESLYPVDSGNTSKRAQALSEADVNKLVKPANVAVFLDACQAVRGLYQKAYPSEQECSEEITGIKADLDAHIKTLNSDGAAASLVSEVGASVRLSGKVRGYYQRLLDSEKVKAAACDKGQDKGQTDIAGVGNKVNRAQVAAQAIMTRQHAIYEKESRQRQQRQQKRREMAQKRRLEQQRSQEQQQDEQAEKGIKNPSSPADNRSQTTPGGEVLTGSSARSCLPNSPSDINDLDSAMREARVDVAPESASSNQMPPPGKDVGSQASLESDNSNAPTQTNT